MKKQDEISDERILDFLKNSWVRTTDKFTAPPIALCVGDSIIGTLGNFSASTGKAKSKKTFNVCAIVASAMINGTILHYSATLPENKRKILYIDTEQSRFHCHRVLKRILKLSNLSTETQPEMLGFLSLRKYSPNVRLQIIE
ncbi:MAG: mobilization protein, partial [Bacteroidales bacterium]|nr:mobilization protein [Bacteroidales bacterium]